MIRIPQWNIVIAYSFTSDAKSQQAKAYEERVRIAVNAISRTQTGRAILKTFSSPPDPDTAVWIMPYNGPVGDCNSKTGAFYGERLTPEKKPEKSWEGVKIQYSPERFAMDDCGWYPGLRPEETLFHEMVHAARDLNNPQYDNTPLDLMADYEEFLAVLVTNMYRSEQGAKKFHRDYILKLLVDQREAELFLSSKRQYLDALKELMEDPKIKALVDLKMDFNPFRDYQRIEADHNDLREMLDALNPLGPILEAQRLKEIGKKLTEQRDMSIRSSAKVMHGK